MSLIFVVPLWFAEQAVFSDTFLMCSESFVGGYTPFRRLVFRDLDVTDPRTTAQKSGNVVVIPLLTFAEHKELLI